MAADEQSKFNSGGLLNKMNIKNRRSFVIPVLDMSPASPYNIVSLLEDLKNIPGEVIVVFNSLEMAEKLKDHPRIDYYAAMKKNVGVSRAWNIGLNISQAPVTFILNSDLHLKKETIDNLETYLLKLPDSAIVGPQGSFFNFEKAKDMYYLDKGAFKNPIKVDAVSGFLFAVKTELFNSGVLKFDNQYTPCYFEEWDLGLQIKQNGLYSYVVPVNGYEHEWSGSLRALRKINYFDKEETAGEIIERNRKLFWEKWKGIAYVERENTNLLVSYLKDILISQAEDLINKNYSEEAEKALIEILNQYPDDTAVLEKLGLLFYKSDKMNQALECFEKIERIDPEYKITNISGKGTLSNIDEIKENNLLLTNEIREEELHELKMQGLNNYKNKYFTEAISSFSNYLNYKPDDFEIQNLLGVSFTNLGKLTEAKECFIKSLQYNKEFKNANFNLGLVEFALKEFKQAASNLIIALLEDPNNEEATETIIKCFEESKFNKEYNLYSKYSPNDISTVIRFSSLDNPFIDACIDNILPFSNKVVLIACNKLWDGTDDLEGIQKIIERNKHKKVEFHIVDLDTINTTHLTYHSEWVVQGLEFVKNTAPFILYIDGDEIADPKLFAKWKNNFMGSIYTMRFLNYYYFREPIYQSSVLENSPLLISAKFLEFLIDAGYSTLLNQMWDRNFFNFRQIKYNQEIIFHHYSWVRTKEQMLKKVITWHHKNERDWTKLVEEEFSREFNGKDFVHGYQYKKVPNYFNISL